MKFDFVIGNPPYQDNTLGENESFAPPVYNLFMDQSYSVADKVELIHPARFLFNAGATPKSWNQKMLNDEHFKILLYEPKSSTIFPNTDIKAGIAISYRDNSKEFGSIGQFLIYNELKSIISKVDSNKNLGSIVYSSEAYHFTEIMHEDFPNIEELLSKGHKYDFKSNVLEKLDGIVFFDSKIENYSCAKIIGVIKNTRCEKYIKDIYIKSPDNYNFYKVFLSRANGSGTFGEALTPPFVVDKETGHTQTFMSIGKFNTQFEASACCKYIKTKFLRTLFGVKKVTQSIPISAWEMVPLQDFTENSDIDWTKSISEIDQQLYKKYNLTQDEINFIEEKVKEME